MIGKKSNKLELNEQQLSVLAVQSYDQLIFKLSKQLSTDDLNFFLKALRDRISERIDK